MEVSALRQSSLPGLPGSTSLLRLQSDERLIALIRRGHHAAFEALVSRYQARLLSFCRHMLGSKEDAEDVLQEVFAAAFNAIIADERDINVRPWLYRIARNRSLNHLRRATPVGVDSMDIYYAENGQSTGEKILRRESFRQLIGDVQELPETQRTALLLREIDALSYEQIAETMETTVPSVKSLLVRARISLAEAAEARKLTCDEVRLELGEAAEGLVKVSPLARRHLRGCERCVSFKKHLKDNNHALAAIMPVAPLLMLKKLILTKLGSTASAGAGHVAGAGGATATAGASAAVGAGAAAGGSGGIGGLAGLGAGALATKAAATLAAAALVTAGAVEANHANGPRHRHHHSAVASASASATHHEIAPEVIRSEAQPVTESTTPIARASTSTAHHAPAHLAHKKAKQQPPAREDEGTTATATSTTPTTATPAPPPVKPEVSKPVVTEVTSETTELPPSTTATVTPPADGSLPSATPPASQTPPAEPAPSEPVAAPPTTTTGETPPPASPPPPEQSASETQASLSVSESAGGEGTIPPSGASGG